MKLKFKNIGFGILFASTLTACDLDIDPTNALPAEKAFSTTVNADEILQGTWQNVFNDAVTYASVGFGAIQLNDDFAGSDAVRAVSYGFSYSYNLTDGYGRRQINSIMWDIAYKSINNCNGIIKNIETIQGNETDKKRIEGQAYATRGFMYLLLASHYSFAIDKDPNAVCVPIYTEPTTTGEQALTGKAASNVTEVYDRAISDLKKGLELIPEDYSHGPYAVDQYRIDHVVAMGLLARASLYARHWQDAYDYASKTLQAHPYLMNETEYKSGFSDCSNKEWIWSYSSTIDDSFPSYIFHFKDATSKQSYYQSLCVDPYFAALFTADDYRGDLYKQWQPTSQSSGVNYLVNEKFKFKDVKNQLGDIVLMRSSELYLIKAEAAARLGLTSEAQQALQTLQNARMKDGKAPTVTATGDELIKEIWLERRKELFGEGFALTDIIRNQQSVARTYYQKTENDELYQGHRTVTFADGTAFVPNSKFYLYRIPQSEELQNPDLYSKYPKLDFYR